MIRESSGASSITVGAILLEDGKAKELYEYIINQYHIIAEKESAKPSFGTHRMVLSR